MKTQWKERLQEGDEVSVTSRGSQGGERSDTLPQESFVEVPARAKMVRTDLLVEHLVQLGEMVEWVVGAKCRVFSG